MAYNKSRSKSTKQGIVDETIDLFNRYNTKRDTWATQVKQDKEYRLGRQWTNAQIDTLKARGQAPIVVNRIHPAVETAKAMLTANRPSFRCAPREDSDNKVANVMSALLAYVYDISSGRSVVRQAVDDYYVCGMGFIQVYQDSLADMGKGEVKIKDIDPLDVYVDPNSRDRFFDDAENVIVSRLFTRDQAESMYPDYKRKIKNAGGNYDDKYPATEAYNDGQVHFPEDVGMTESTEYIRGYERYYKVRVDKKRTYEHFSGKEEIMDESEYLEKYVHQPAWEVNGRFFTDKRAAEQTVEQIKQQMIQKHQQQVQQMINNGYDPETIPPPDQKQIPKIVDLKYMNLIADGHIEVVDITITRIHMCVIMGDKKLYSRELPTDKYPIVPIMNIHTRTPYPLSDVRMVKGIQDYINKTRSLIIAHATTSTNTKILVPEGSVDMNEFEQKWAQPGVAIPYDPTDGPPVTVQPTPLPNELYQNEISAKNDLDHQLGLYEMMMGNSSVAPQTYKATISLDEFGQRKMKSKLADIETSLVRIGEVAIKYIQQLYTQRKAFRVIQPNNSLSEYVINKRLYDDKTGEVKKVNDICVGSYDVIVVSGSTLPSNRYAELEFYMDAYSKGIIDRQEVLKKTEVFDIEGVMQRTDVIAKLQQQLKQAGQEIKKLKGDLQTRDRESVNLKKKVEVEKFKTGLDKSKNKADSATRLYESRLGDELSTIQSKIADATNAAKQSNTSKK
tara:strand:+ start:1171 stop:3360 length:2190 start_codon:yes stop_codon:yes gene_type:complete